MSLLDFAVGFAIGVVTGAVITIRMGLNWGVCGERTGRSSEWRS
ncbi:hypothetical protein AB0H92_04985 [Streptomyces phaeochromogenes]